MTEAVGLVEWLLYDNGLPHEKVKKITAYYDNNLLLRTTKIICEKKKKSCYYSNKTRFRKSYQYKLLRVAYTLREKSKYGVISGIFDCGAVV